MHSNFDDRVPVKIVRVTPRSPKGRYYVEDSLGRTYGTKNVLVATLATRYMEKQWTCRPYSYPGWVRDLIGLQKVEEA